MFKLFTASTEEVDDPQIAADEILSQLNLAENARKNSFAIIACHYEFITGGVIAALRGKLPFPIVGCTTHGSGADEKISLNQLAIGVFTSDDDVAFQIVTAEINSEHLIADLRASYELARGKMPFSPKMILSFIPFRQEFKVEPLLEEIDKISGGLPIFGTLPAAFPLEPKYLSVINDDENNTTSKVTLLLVGGQVSPNFFCRAATDSQLNTVGHFGTITKATDSLVEEIDNIEAAEFMRRNGINDEMALQLTPILKIESEIKSTPIGGTLTKIVGGSLGGAAMRFPVGAKIAPIKVPKRSEIFATFDAVVADIYAEQAKRKISAIFVVSCISRAFALSPDDLCEMQAAFAKLSAIAPVFFLYSGGEICPVKNLSGKPVNRFHNYTLSALTF